MSTTVSTQKATTKPLGRMEWATVQAEVGDATCVWSDLSGMHVGALPDQQPIATHLWAWRGQTAWRLRLDLDIVIGARLTLDAAGHDVMVHSIGARTTPDPALADELAGLVAEVRLVTTMDAAPVSFLIESLS